MDHNELWRQIKLTTKVRLGIDTETLLRSPSALQFDVNYPRRRRFIHLNGADLYDIDFGRVNMRSFEWIILGEARVVGVGELNATLLWVAGLD